MTTMTDNSSAVIFRGRLYTYLKDAVYNHCVLRMQKGTVAFLPYQPQLSHSGESWNQVVSSSCHIHSSCIAEGMTALLNRELSYFISSEVSGGFNLYFRDNEEKIRIRHFDCVYQGQAFKNLYASVYRDLNSLIVASKCFYTKHSLVSFTSLDLASDLKTAI